MGRMRFIFWLIVASLLLAAAVPALRGGDRDADALAILAKAWALVDIRASGSGAFILKARARLVEGTKVTDGVFAMAWAAPDRFRRVIGFRDYSETDVARGENYYSKRNTEGVPLMVWKLGELMDSLSARKSVPGGAKVKRVENLSVGGKAATCVSIAWDAGDSRICVDAATAEVLSIEKALDGPDESRERLEFGDYQDFGGKRFPRHFAYSGWNKRAIEVTIEKLDSAREFAADEFTPPAASEISRLCNGAEEMTGQAMPMFGDTRPVGFSHLDVYIFVDISPMGYVRSAQIVSSSDAKADKEVLRWYLGTNFPVKTCDGRAIGYQSLFHYVASR
jgi:hypothetical protein